MKLQDIIKTDHIIKVSPESTLTTTLANLGSSHDAAFVFDKDKFVGLVNPYYCLIKSSFPGNAKLQHCLFHPPKIYLTDSVARVASHMTESRMHYLPVFNPDNSFAGIISARRLLATYANLPIFNVAIAEVLKAKSRPVISVYEDDSVAQAVTQFKERKVSKLVVVGKDLKLKGVLSHYDLISYLITPKQRENHLEHEGVKTHFSNLKVKNFEKTYVLTLSPANTMAQALRLILDKKIGSVIVVDETRHPLGVITTRDILTLLKNHDRKTSIEVTTKHLSNQSRQILNTFYQHLLGGLKKIPDLSKVKLFVKEEKNGGLFKVVLSLFPVKGQAKVIEQEGKNLQQVLHKVEKKEK